MNKKKEYAYYYIYLTKNLVNGKKYVGWHATNKLYDAYIGSGHFLTKSIKKYGKKNFINGIIEFCNETNFLQQEKYWIKEYNTMTPNGYNLTEGGEGAIGYKHTLENIEFFKNRKHSEESKKKMSLAKLGKKLDYKLSHTQETKDKISKVLSQKYIGNKIEVVKLFNEGKSYKEIEYLLKCSSKFIIKTLKENNIKSRSWADYHNHKLKGETKNKLSIIHNKKNESKWNEIKDLYIKGYTTKQIMKELNTSPNTVTKVIKKYNLKKDYGKCSKL